MWRQPGLHREFQDRQSYLVRLLQKKIYTGSEKSGFFVVCLFGGMGCFGLFCRCSCSWATVNSYTQPFLSSLSYTYLVASSSFGL